MPVLAQVPVQMHDKGGDKKQPVTLEVLLQGAVSSHPLVRGALSEVEAAERDINAAKRRRWPTVSAVVESQSGSALSGPSRFLQFEQTLWDAGRTGAVINQAEAGADKSKWRVQLQREQLQLQVVSGWQSLLSARDRIRIAQNTLERLKLYEDQMRRRVQVNASPQIDLELVLSRRRQTEVDLTVALASSRVAASRLAQLSGVEGVLASVLQLPEWPAQEVIDKPAVTYLKADIDAIARSSVAVKVARGDAAIAQAQFEAKKAEQWPTAYVRASQPIGASRANVEDRTGSIFFGLRYTPGAGFATAVEAEAIGKRVESAEQLVEASYLEQREALVNDREEFLSTHGRVRALMQAVEGATQILDSYSRQFTAGRKSWIDLLNALRELSQNQVLLVDSQASMVSSLYRLQIREGRGSLVRQSIDINER